MLRCVKCCRQMRNKRAEDTGLRNEHLESFSGAALVSDGDAGSMGGFSRERKESNLV